MSKLLNAASSFANAIASAPRNCYWYGAATNNGGVIVPLPAVNPCGCSVPQSITAAGANIGWSDPKAFALVGTDGAGQPLAYTDCTGFAAWVIAQTSPADFAAFLSWDQANRQHFVLHDQPWPSAAAYAYAGYGPPIGGNWSVVVNATQSPQDWTTRVQPGDLLAWDIQPVKGKVTDTGHIVVLSSPLQPANSTTYEVGVIDCSRDAHGNDSRTNGKTGVGTGSILLQYSGDAWQYSFGTSKSLFHPAPHISVLRLNV